MKNTKKEELKKSMLLAGEGFLKKLSLKELYAESSVWKYVERLGLLQTKNWPTDKDGNKYWNSSYDLKKIRYHCIRVICCKDEKTFDELFDDLGTAAFIVTKFGALPVEYLNMLLSWVALKFIKNPSFFVRKYTRVLKNTFFSLNPYMVQHFIDTMGYEEYQKVLFKQHPMLTPKDELQIAGFYQWIYRNMEMQQPLIKKYRDQGIYLKITPELESPQKMYGSWWQQTKHFNLIRIGELLSLWEKKSDKLIIVNHIKKDYERWNIDGNDERKIKREFFNDLYRSLKNDDCIHLICRLQEENMSNIIKIDNLTDENERNKQYCEEEKKRNQELMEKRYVIYNDNKHFETGAICEDHSMHIYIDNKTNPNKNKNIDKL